MQLIRVRGATVGAGNVPLARAGREGRRADDYKCVAERLTEGGGYGQGVLSRELPSNWSHDQVMALADNREEVDESLSLLGLVLVCNELKVDAADAIATLNGGDIRTEMTRTTTPCAATTLRAERHLEIPALTTSSRLALPLAFGVRS
ncbi:hypothetical protein PHYPSEUDO_014399 [Phytophthora pseudosyringae]|uniref:Uncharacterized protein n=1 Tax=Phytophthora pseudosyringae TaxID=221518 RepID=A0A8T1V990_9STRA|nr:hypothetical protein PHYPSEUDO_014399 [Phytophthora pseudosyringae]